MALLAGGASNAKIAQTLFVTPNTVRTHLDRIRDKTGARNRAELTRYALQAGIEPSRSFPLMSARPAHTQNAWWAAGLCRRPRAGPYVLVYENQIQQGTDLYEGNYRLGGIHDRVSGVSLQPPAVQRHRRGTQFGGECVERQSFLHTASGWLALICLVTAVALLALKHKDSIVRRPEPAPAPGRPSNFCATCGTRIITGDRFCQGCGAQAEPAQSGSRN